MYNLAETTILRQRISNLNGFCFTIDIDWASEFAIKNILDFFEENNIPLTVFSTHKSHYLEEKLSTTCLDVGLHPNFIFPSTQGNTIDTVIDYCHQLYPYAESFRCHRWYSSNDIYDKLSRCGLKYESNICTAFNLLPPFIHRSGLISFPTFFEDGAYLYHQLDLDFKNTEYLFSSPGLRVIDLHPMHFAVNTPYFKYMRDIKDRLQPSDWNNLDADNIKKLRFDGLGIKDYIQNLVEYIHTNKLPVFSLKEIYRNII